MCFFGIGVVSLNRNFGLSVLFFLGERLFAFTFKRKKKRKTFDYLIFICCLYEVYLCTALIGVLHCK